MPTEFRCTTCNQILSTASHTGDTPISCPECGNVTAIPAASAGEWWMGEASNASVPTPPTSSDQAPAPVETNGSAWWLGSPTSSPVPVANQTKATPPPLPAGRVIPVVPAIAGLVGLLVVAVVVAWLSLPGSPPQSVQNNEQADSSPAPAEPTLATPEKPIERVTETPVAAPVAPVAPAPETIRLPEPVQPPRPEVAAVIPERKADEEARRVKEAADRAEAEKVAREKAETDKRAADNPVREKPAPLNPETLVVKRRDRRSADELRMQIEKVPELTLDHTPERLGSLTAVANAVRALRAGKPTDTTPHLILARGDLVGLPLLMGDACKIGPTNADHLQGGSVALRQHLFEATNAGAARAGRVTLTVAGAPAADPRPDPNKLQSALNNDSGKHNKWQKPEAVPALQQLLMAENEAVREVLVEQLERIPGVKSSVALAQRALFDLNPDVREKAIKALARRPAEEYRQTLLDGFKHPWSPVADHAAEALATLKMKDCVPALVGMLDMPDPQLPHERPKVGPVVKEMVRINHLRNCLMCHAPSFSSEDKVRGFVPPINQPLPPAFSREYYAPKREGTFVRADVTYLRQDFSVPLEVKNPGQWPSAQRFDFMVRERPANLREIAALKSIEKSRTPTEHQKALFFVLRELTGQDPGPSVEDWKKAVLGKKLEARLLRGGFKLARGLAVDRAGHVYVNDAGVGQVVCLTDSRPEVFVKNADGFNGLAIDPKGQLLVADSFNGRVLRLDSSGVEQKVVAGGLKGKRFDTPRSLLVDSSGGIYLVDGGPVTDPFAKGEAFYVSQHGTVTRLPLELTKPRALGVSPDGRTLYAVTATSQEVMAYPLESAGLPGKGRVLGKLEVPRSGMPQGGSGLVVDDRGNLFVLNPALNAVQVLNSEGARLSTTVLPDMPIACTLGGESGKRAVFVLTRTAVYRIEVAEAVRTVRAD